MVPDERWDEWLGERLALLSRNLAGEHDDLLTQIAPSRAGDPSFRDWYARAGRQGASPATARRIWESVLQSTAADQLLDHVTVPTLVCTAVTTCMRRPAARSARPRGFRVPQIVELEGADQFVFAGDVDALVAEIAEFVLGERRLPPPLSVAGRVRFDLAAAGLAIYVGIHIGDVDRRGDDISGLAVTMAARAMAIAEPGEVVVTASVVTATLGQSAQFESVGVHQLKGVPGDWELFRLATE